MKKFLLALCLIPTLTCAAEKIQDMSMTPQETMKVIGTGNTGGDGTQPLNGMPGLGAPATVPTTAAPTAESLAPTSYMTGYCDPANKPVVQLTGQAASMQECSAKQRLAACDAFKKLPADAQRTVSDTIECNFDATGRDCHGYDGARLDLIKSYWSNQAVAQTILFLPDLIMHPRTDCR
jgi:hypothetical protein